MQAPQEGNLALRLGRPAGSFPALESLDPAQQKRLCTAVEAAVAAHEQALQASLPFWLRALIRAFVRPARS